MIHAPICPIVPTMPPRHKFPGLDAAFRPDLMYTWVLSMKLHKRKRSWRTLPAERSGWQMEDLYF